MAGTGEAAVGGIGHILSAALGEIESEPRQTRASEQDNVGDQAVGPGEGMTNSACDLAPARFASLRHLSAV